MPPGAPRDRRKFARAPSPTPLGIEVQAGDRFDDTFDSRPAIHSRPSDESSLRSSITAVKFIAQFLPCDRAFPITGTAFEFRNEIGIEISQGGIIWNALQQSTGDHQSIRFGKAERRLQHFVAVCEHDSSPLRRKMRVACRRISYSFATIRSIASTSCWINASSKPPDPGSPYVFGTSLSPTSRAAKATTPAPPFATAAPRESMPRSPRTAAG